MREEPELPNFEPIDSPARSPEEDPQEEVGDPTLGCSAYGKSQRQRPNIRSLLVKNNCLMVCDVCLI